MQQIDAVAPAKDCLCLLLQVYVKRGNLVFKDVVDWDLSNPDNTAMAYAALTCQDLGLNASWCLDITTHVQGLIDELRQVMVVACFDISAFRCCLDWLVAVRSLVHILAV